MKKTFLIFNPVILFFFFFSCRNNETPQISFEHLEHNFGEVYGLDTLIYEFRFTNEGLKELSVNNVRTECECTAAYWTKEPLKKSANGSILIKYKTSFAKEFKEIIYVYHNGENSPTRLSVQGKIFTN